MASKNRPPPRRAPNIQSKLRQSNSFHILLSPTAAYAWSADGPSQEATPQEIATYISQSTDAESTFDSLPAEQQQDFLNYVLPADESPKVDVTTTAADETARHSVEAGNTPNAPLLATATGCWYSTAEGWVQNRYGANVLSFTLSWNWCANGTTVTSSTYSSGTGETHILGWVYHGVIASDAIVIANTGRAFNQHSFSLNVGGWDVDSTYPCMRGYGDYIGNSSAEYACGLN